MQRVVHCIGREPLHKAEGKMREEELLIGPATLTNEGVIHFIFHGVLM